MNITRGPYSVNVDPIRIIGRPGAEYQVVVSRYGHPVYEHLEHDFLDAMRLAQAYIDWEVENHSDG